MTNINMSDGSDGLANSYIHVSLPGTVGNSSDVTAENGSSYKLYYRDDKYVLTSMDKTYDSKKMDCLTDNLDDLYCYGAIHGSGCDKSEWTFKNLQVFMRFYDGRRPYVKELLAPEGTFYRGDKIFVSARFNEIVNVSGTPTITTNVGTFTYAGGSGTNILYFEGEVTGIAASEMTLTKLYGTVKDIIDNSFYTSAVLSVTDDFSIAYELRVEGDGTKSNPYQITNTQELPHRPEL